MKYKKCWACKNSYPETLDYFYKSKFNKSGLTSDCKQCVNKRTSKWAKENKKRCRDNNKKCQKK